MNTIEQLQQAFAAYLSSTFNLSPEQLNTCQFALNVDEQKQQFGDLNSNAPMVIAKLISQNPKNVAQQIIDEFSHPALERIEIAGPGFLNAFFSVDTVGQLASQLGTQRENFFKLPSNAPKHNYSIEFVSANPTGPLHFGHGRGGIVGDVLGNILTFIGHKATKEFYINDAGSQMAKLGISLKIRCKQLTGIEESLPEDAYHGEYLIAIAQQCINEHGSSVIDKPEEFFTDYAYHQILAAQKETLKKYGIDFDVWFSENTLHKSGAIERALEILAHNKYLYEQDGAIWFKATAFGDDKDRVVKKTDGEYTYAAADIAYLLNKSERGFDRLIMVLGQDHHSYAVRLEAIRQALNIPSSLAVILYQLVRMESSGQLVRMSKRAGTIVTLDDVLDTVGTDVTRFFYLNRKVDAQLVFDLDLALKQTDENPVYYIQYAYVRTNGILQKASKEKLLDDIGQQDVKHIGKSELFLIKKIVYLKELLESISGNHQTHLLAYYVMELASLFHKYYSHNKIIDLNNIQTSRARLYVITILNNTLKVCLELLGVSAPEQM